MKLELTVSKSTVCNVVGGVLLLAVLSPSFVDAGQIIAYYTFKFLGFL